MNVLKRITGWSVGGSLSGSAIAQMKRAQSPWRCRSRSMQPFRAEATRFFVVPSIEHVEPRIERVVQREDRYWVVEKIGIGEEMSEALDPRST